MLAKTSRLVIGKLLDPLVSDDRTGIPHIITSPKSPLEFKIRSPRCLKNCDPGVVGLSIVAALEKSSSGAGQIPVKFDLGSLNLNLSDPIPIGSSITSSIFRGGSGRTEMGCMATYNYVAAHIPNKSTFTGVHCDGGEDNSGDHDRSSFDRTCKKLCVSSNSPPRCINAIPAFPTSDFLSSCYLCRKKLHGRDIFMYRGEKAFCSSECRYKQIGIDERKEKCRSESSRPADVSGSPYTGGQLFSTGIIVA